MEYTTGRELGIACNTLRMLVFKGVTTPGLSIFFEKYFVFTTPLGNLDETLDKERSHCENMHIVMGAMCNYF
jgi:hypothetical protein